MRRRRRGSCLTRCVGLRLADKRHARSATKNDKVRFDQSLVRFLSLLLLAFNGYRFLAAQRRKTDNESAGLHETGNIEVNWIAHSCVRVTDHHLARVNQNRIAHMVRSIQSASAFQHQKLTNAGMIFDHGGRPRHRGRDASRMNCRAIRALRRLNQHCALTQVQIVRAVFEAEGGVGREAHNRFVGKSQFSVRVLAGSQNRSFPHANVQRRSTACSDRVKQLNIVRCSRDTCFVE